MPRSFFRKLCSACLLFLLAVAFPLHSIELTTPDWEIVADGVSVSRPQKTSWGYVTVTDGRTLIGWTESGKKVFQRKLKRKPSELLCADPSDFIWSVSQDRQYLSCFNADGVLLWERKLAARCGAANLVPGRDGRLFVPLENGVLCVDINGRIIWNYTLSDGPLLTLAERTDGSLLCNGKITLSPFGDVLSESETAPEDEFVSLSSKIHTVCCDFVTVTGNRNCSVTAFDFEGNELWRKSFAPESVLFYEITDNTIMTLSESWVIAGYRYDSSPAVSPEAKKLPSRIYEATYAPDDSVSTESSSMDDYSYRLLVNGLKRIVSTNETFAVNPSARDVPYDIKLLRQAEASGYDFSSLIADIILTESDTQVLSKAAATAGSIGRDPDGRIFDAIETRLKQRTYFQFDDSIYASFCDALYSICAVSGTYARMVRALQIISPLTSTDYHTLVHEHASRVMEKLILLQQGRIQ